MRYLSICSGIEAASVAWAPLGWMPAAFADNARFPSALLSHHYPDVPNLGDITKFEEWPDLGSVDIVCGGTPCQAFSVAGFGQGLADPRGNLALTFLAIVRRYRPRLVVWENVTGVLGTNDGRDFAAFLGGLGLLGYGWCYRVLDAQYVRVDGFARAVPQRRRRVFVVGYLGNWQRAAAILSDAKSVLGDHPPSRGTPEGFAAATRRGLARGRGPIGGDRGTGGLISTTVNAKWRKRGSGPAGDECGNLIAFNAREDTDVSGAIAGPLGSSSPQAQAIAYDDSGWQIRRLTPLECERLQGFPDHYTAIPYRGRAIASDFSRYNALGNSWAVNCARWIGRGIQFVDEVAAELGIAS